MLPTLHDTLSSVVPLFASLPPVLRRAAWATVRSRSGSDWDTVTRVAAGSLGLSSGPCWTDLDRLLRSMMDVVAAQRSRGPLPAVGMGHVFATVATGDTWCIAVDPADTLRRWHRALRDSWQRLDVGIGASVASAPLSTAIHSLPPLEEGTAMSDCDDDGDGDGDVGAVRGDDASALVNVVDVCALARGLLSPHDGDE